jgi:hypothetical protein
LADVFVAVDAGVKFFFGIVEMERGEQLNADGFVEFAEGSFVALPGSQIVASGEGVLGVETSRIEG